MVNSQLGPTGLVGLYNQSHIQQTRMDNCLIKFGSFVYWEIISQCYAVMLSSTVKVSSTLSSVIFMVDLTD